LRRELEAGIERNNNLQTQLEDQSTKSKSARKGKTSCRTIAFIIIFFKGPMDFGTFRNFRNSKLNLSCLLIDRSGKTKMLWSGQALLRRSGSGRKNQTKTILKIYIYAKIINYGRL
jgi:hypothetical protein